MKTGGFIAALCLVTAIPDLSLAQMKILPKEVVESAVSPRMSQDSAYLHFETRHIVAEPMNEDDSPVSFVYRFKNVGEKQLQIERLVSTCSCMTVQCQRQSVLPGESADIVVRYNPKGHPGRFERRIFVYTSGDDPAAVLRLSVHVAAGADLSGEWPVQKGGIRMRRDDVSFRYGEKAVEKLRFINLTGKDLSLDCERNFLPACLSFRTEPQVVPDGQNGEIIISYDPSKEAKEQMKIILKGLGIPPSQSSINVKMKKDQDNE